MQWLIDIVNGLAQNYIDAYFATHPRAYGYFDRGDPAVSDFAKGDFTRDGSWHTLDLSSIVPADAVAVAFTARLVSTNVSKVIQLRRHGNVNGVVRSIAAIQAANIPNYVDMFIACDPDRKIDYKIHTDPWTVIDFSVKGWWLGGPTLSGFVNRGDPAVHDFKTGDFTKDSAWHELDLAAIIPANAKSILMQCFIMAGATGQFVRFRTSGNTNTQNVSECRMVLADRAYSYDIIIPVADLQKIEYYATSGPWTILYLIIKGWWY